MEIWWDLHRNEGAGRARDEWVVALLQRSDLTPRARAVGGAFGALVSCDGVALAGGGPALSRVAAAAGVTIAVARAEFDALVASGWILAEDVPGQGTAYQLTPAVLRPRHSASIF